MRYSFCPVFLPGVWSFDQLDKELKNQHDLLKASQAGHWFVHEQTWQANDKMIRAIAKAETEAADAASAALMTSALNGLQTTLDFAGFAPGVGAVPDLINAAISAGRGNWGEAAVNVVAAIPFWGDAAKGGKMLAKGGKEVVEHADDVAKVADDVVEGIAKRSDGAANELIDFSDSNQVWNDQGVVLMFVSRLKCTNCSFQTDVFRETADLHARIIDFAFQSRIDHNITIRAITGKDRECLQHLGDNWQEYLEEIERAFAGPDEEIVHYDIGTVPEAPTSAICPRCLCASVVKVVVGFS